MIARLLIEDSKMKLLPSSGRARTLAAGLVPRYEICGNDLSHKAAFLDFQLCLHLCVIHKLFHTRLAGKQVDIGNFGHQGITLKCKHN